MANTASEALSGSTEDSAGTHPQVNMKLEKPLAWTRNGSVNQKAFIVTSNLL